MNFEGWVSRLAAAVTSETTELKRPSDDLERICVVLLVEIARADHSIDVEERAAIATAIAQGSVMSRPEIDALIDETIAEVDNTISLHEHVSRLNDQFDRPAKVLLIERMWRVAVSDGDIDRYEEYAIRKLADLLYVKHRDFIQAKLRVIDDQAAGGGGARPPS